MCIRDSSRIANPGRFAPGVLHPPIHWTWIPGGDHARLLHVFRRMLEEATDDITWVLHLWQNSLRHITVDQARAETDRHIQLVNNYNRTHNYNHRLVWPETALPPELDHLMEKIQRINLVLRLANTRCGFPPCRPNRVTSPVRSRSSSRQAITTSRWREAVAGTGRGYHVSDRYLRQYFEYFRRWLKFNDSD